ncbi:V-type ATP synthase subunit K [Candidatus Woesearchaeota archaeon]|nr:V-type ATP synthase subunit K [Candidatus Woesearchaeota archaeon]
MAVAETVANLASNSTGMIAFSAALAIAGSAIAAAWAEKAIGSAAIGAMAEKEELFGKGLILTVIPETIVIFGFAIAFFILGLAK